MNDGQIEHLRALEFPGPERATYLNAAGFGPLPERTRRVLNDFTDKRHRCELRDADLMAALRAARASAARLIGSKPEEIALTPNTNVGINIAANAVLARSADRQVILVSDREFPANVYPWLALQQHGYTVEIVAADARGLPREDAILQRISAGDVAALSISFVQFASGYRANLAALSEACARQQTLFIVDAIQGLGAVPLDVQHTPIDILACGAQKWLCSPWGSGFTYIREGLINSFDPAFPGWLSFESSSDFTSLLDYDYAFVKDARRFETGSLAFQDQLGMSHSIDLLLEIGIDQIWQHLLTLQQPIIDWAAQRGVEIIRDLETDRRSGILCIRPQSAAEAHAALRAAGIACAFRENSIRLSPHWYNTGSDIARLLDVLNTALS